LIILGKPKRLPKKYKKNGRSRISKKLKFSFIYIQDLVLLFSAENWDTFTICQIKTGHKLPAGKINE